MAIPGYATAEGTRGYAARFSGVAGKGHFRTAGGLTFSSIGIGTYLGATDAPTDALVTDAVVASVAGGINVIDTASNYRYGRGETSVGAALARVRDEGIAAREELVVCTKGGFLPHPDRERWFEREYVGRDGIEGSDLVRDVHCMHPAYISSEIERSRRNLGIETIDVYYLHNPETQAAALPPEIFEARLSAAFAALEMACLEGRIRAYGLATWTAFRVPQRTAGHVSLLRSKNAAREAAADGKDRLKFVQLPFNRGMPEALVDPTQAVSGDVLPALPAARRLGLNPILSAAIGQNKLGKMKPNEIETLGADLAGDAIRTLQLTRSAPGAIAALVGMKSPEHVSENLGLVARPPLSPKTVLDLLSVRR